MTSVKILTVVGSRPQFIKAVMVSRALKKLGIREFLIHTGQHYDASMSEVFFRELGISKPFKNLHVGSGTHAEQTSAAMMAVEKLCLKLRPDGVLVYGDTNATLSGALAAAKLKIPVIHVEAGLRSHDMDMPEEVNRVITDSVASILFCPTRQAVAQLKRESHQGKIFWVGDVMYDASCFFRSYAHSRSGILKKLGIQKKKFSLVTIHRDFNTDDPVRMRTIAEGLLASQSPVVFPLHPRTRVRLEKLGLLRKLKSAENLRLIDPVGYLDMICLESRAEKIITDSGGVQKEAFFLKTPCWTVRPSTEWKETVTSGWNRLLPAKSSLIASAIRSPAWRGSAHPSFYGRGDAASKIARMLHKHFSR